MDCVVQQALHGKVCDGVEEGQEGGRVQRLAAQVEGAEEAERGRQQRPHTGRSPMYAGH